LLDQEGRTRLDQLLDLEHAVDDDERSSELLHILNGVLLPVLKRGGTLTGLRHMAARTPLSSALMTGDAQELVGYYTP
jgi:hypothetical protein